MILENSRREANFRYMIIIYIYLQREWRARKSSARPLPCSLVTSSKLFQDPKLIVELLLKWSWSRPRPWSSRHISHVPHRYLPQIISLLSHILLILIYHLGELVKWRQVRGSIISAANPVIKDHPSPVSDDIYVVKIGKMESKAGLFVIWTDYCCW